MESGGRHLDDESHVADQLGDDRKIAVIAGTGRCQKALRHFPLHEKDGSLETGIERQEFFNNGRSNVIRQITCYDRGPPLREIYRESIGMMNVQLVFSGEFSFQLADERRINFNCMQFVGERKQMAGESSAPGSDFDYAIYVAFAGGSCKPVENRITDEKVLSQLAWQRLV